MMTFCKTKSHKQQQLIAQVGFKIAFRLQPKNLYHKKIKKYSSISHLTNETSYGASIYSIM